MVGGGGGDDVVVGILVVDGVIDGDVIGDLICGGDGCTVDVAVVLDDVIGGYLFLSIFLFTVVVFVSFDIVGGSSGTIIGGSFKKWGLIGGGVELNDVCATDHVFGWCWIDVGFPFGMEIRGGGLGRSLSLYIL